MHVRFIKVIFQDEAVLTKQLGKHDSLSDFFINYGIELVAPATTVKQILFLDNRSLQWEDITADWLS